MRIAPASITALAAAASRIPTVAPRRSRCRRGHLSPDHLEQQPVEQVSGRSFPATPGFRSVSRSPSHCRPTQPPEREAIQQSSSTPGRLYRLSDCGTLAWCPVGTPDQRFSPASSASGWVVAPSTGHASMGTTHMISISMPYVFFIGSGRASMVAEHGPLPIKTQGRVVCTPINCRTDADRRREPTRPVPALSAHIGAGNSLPLEQRRL